MARRFIAHTGNECPVSSDAIVDYTLAGDRSGDAIHRGCAGDLYWGPSLAEDGAGRIMLYAVKTDDFERSVADFMRSVTAPPPPKLDTIDRAVQAFNLQYPDCHMTADRARVLLALLGQK